MANVIIANIFKTVRLLHMDDAVYTQTYTRTISTLQEIAESHRDSILRAYLHIDNHHKGLLKAQSRELRDIRAHLSNILNDTSRAMLNKAPVDYASIAAENQRLKDMVADFNKRQIVRIQAGASKTRLSILFYGLMWDIQKISEATLNLLNVFQESFHADKGK